MPKWDSLNSEALLTELQHLSVEEGISDIHASPEKDSVRLEVRLHGVLQQKAVISPAVYEDLLRQVKFAAHLKLNITTSPQDGQYSFAAKERQVNVRVATLPSHFGETLTLRLLDPKRGIRPLGELGFPSEIQEGLQQIVHMPHGLFLVTGPTGSGKTTTLYALLATLVGKARNIITLEDPVEYELPGVVQSQVQPDLDYTFAAGLRSILRHDPDVILVGEVRDLETAQTAVDAALTGHLVLATLHTNSAIEAIPRLLSMGVTPYTFAPALRGILAQRLVRTIANDASMEESDPSDPATYNGRISVPELLTISPALREMILANATADALLVQAVDEGFKGLQHWAGLLLEAGRTTKTEVERVIL